MSAEVPDVAVKWAEQSVKSVYCSECSGKSLLRGIQCPQSNVKSVLWRVLPGECNVLFVESVDSVMS